MPLCVQTPPARQKKNAVCASLPVFHKKCFRTNEPIHIGILLAQIMPELNFTTRKEVA
jgi:hypothetical protein